MAWEPGMERRSSHERRAWVERSLEKSRGKACKSRVAFSALKDRSSPSEKT